MYYEIPGTNVRILGSVHSFPISNPLLPEWVVQAEQWAQAVVVEMAPGALQPYFKALPSHDLQLEIPIDVWDELAAFWPDDGPLAPLHSLHLWACTLSVPHLHVRSVSGVEAYLEMEAQRKNKSLRYLQHAGEIAQSLLAVPADDLVAALRMLLSDLSAPQKHLESLYKQWRMRDLDGVRQCVETIPLFTIPSLRATMLSARNRAWVEQMQPFLNRPERTLIVVGVLHLFGPDSVLECLGRPIEAIPLKWHFPSILEG